MTDVVTELARRNQLVQDRIPNLNTSVEVVALLNEITAPVLSYPIDQIPEEYSTTVMDEFEGNFTLLKEKKELLEQIENRIKLVIEADWTQLKSSEEINTIRIEMHKELRCTFTNNHDAIFDDSVAKIPNMIKLKMLNYNLGIARNLVQLIEKLEKDLKEFSPLIVDKGYRNQLSKVVTKLKEETTAFMVNVPTDTFAINCSQYMRKMITALEGAKPDFEQKFWHAAADCFIEFLNGLKQFFNGLIGKQTNRYQLFSEQKREAELVNYSINEKLQVYSRFQLTRSDSNDFR